MTLLPIVARELRASARKKYTFYLRVIGAGIVLAVLFVFSWLGVFEPGMGGMLFASLQWALFAAVWVLVPFLVADTVSEERREGTLGLLFLTNMNATEIVAAKGLAHGVRALTLGLAAIPMLALPILIGGVNWPEAIAWILLNLCAGMWAMSAGLVASALTKSWRLSLVLAAIFAVVSMSVFCAVLQLGGGLVTAPRSPLQVFAIVSVFRWAVLSRTINMGVYGVNSWFPAPTGAPGIPGFHGLAFYGELLAASVLVLCLAILLGGLVTRRNWRASGPSARQVWLEEVFCRPVVWKKFFRKWLRRSLDRNPIGWLERRTWSGRLVVWSWLAVLVSIYSAFLRYNSFQRSLSGVHSVMCLLLAGSVALTAAGSFRRERESGVMELLLVSPMAEGEIIFGRLWGLWMQFLPSTVLVLSGWLYLATILEPEEDFPEIVFFAASFICLPVVGLYFSMRRKSLLAAFIGTLAVGLALPLIAAGAFSLYYSIASPFPGSFVSSNLLEFAALIELLMAAFCARGLYRCLKQREFQFAQL